MAGSGTGEEGANRADGLAVPADDPANVALPHLQTEDGRPAAGNFREHDFVGKLDQLPNNELEKLPHESQLSGATRAVQSVKLRSVRAEVPGCRFPHAGGAGNSPSHALL